MPVFRMQLVAIVSLLPALLGTWPTHAETVFFDVRFNDEVVGESPLVEPAFPGETAYAPSEIRGGGVIVADGWTDEVTLETLGGDGDLVAASEAFAVTVFNILEVVEDTPPEAGDAEPFVSVSFDYLMDSTLAGGGKGPGGSQNVFIRFYNSEDTVVSEAMLKTDGGMLITDRNVEYAPGDPNGYLHLADGRNPIGRPDTFRMDINLNEWTYQAFAGDYATPVIPMLDDGLTLQDIAAFRIEHYDTDGDGGLRSDSLLIYDNVLIRQLAEDPTVGPVPLQPGDADQDLDFDQLDLVAVQIGAKYLTGQPATWGEGDWDGGPGGSQGSPPPGNGLFDQLDIIMALGAGKYLQGPYGALAAGSYPSGERSLGLGPSDEYGVSALAVGGSLAEGDLGQVDLVHVPEPSSAILLVLGLAFGLVRVRTTRRHRACSAHIEAGVE